MAVTPNRPAPHADELSEMAIEELDAACGLLWVEMKAVTPWGDTYVGAASSATIPGNGTFFYIKNVQPARYAPSPRVRTVTATTSDCAWEMGVCVIRRDR